MKLFTVYDIQTETRELEISDISIQDLRDTETEQRLIDALDALDVNASFVDTDCYEYVRTA
jgi:hypothetical protein